MESDLVIETVAQTIPLEIAGGKLNCILIKSTNWSTTDKKMFSRFVQAMYSLHLYETMGVHGSLYINKHKQHCPINELPVSPYDLMMHLLVCV